ncbi:hypothetical protein ABER02_22575 [Rossellomorea marisflavi]|uniref:hypothetical protein n=1 Tax=Rossellomorea marisflavi TaxID=189381 RepID=UPI003D2BBF35
MKDESYLFEILRVSNVVLDIDILYLYRTTIPICSLKLEVGTDGTYTLNNILEGKYSLTSSAPRLASTVKSILHEENEVATEIASLSEEPSNMDKLNGGLNFDRRSCHVSIVCLL